jgi:hypothetical protein
MPNITVRQYEPYSGALLGNVSVLSFGKVTAGTTSGVIVLDIAFSEVTNVGGIKLGLISSGGLAVNSNPSGITAASGITADGSASSGRFGVESTSAFDASKSSSGLTRYFAGVNTSVTAADPNNVSIPSRSDAISNYIYLSIQVDSSSIGAGNGSFKIFFDYN